MKDKLFGSLAWVVLAAIVLAGCAPAATPQAETGLPTEPAAPTEIPTQAPTAAPTETEAAEPVILRVAWLGPMVDCLNISYCWTGFWAWQVLYDPIVDYGPVGEVVGRLAESWDVSEDGLTWTFHLVDLEKVTFHDGTPLTAEDVAWTLNYYATNDALVWVLGVVAEELQSVEAVDARTVVMTLANPIAPGAVLDLMAYSYMLPRHIWEQYDAETIYDFENAENIGTGPYMVADWNPDQYLVLDANPQYWKGKPPIDRIVVQYYNTADAMVQALLAGEVDAIEIAPVEFLPTLQGEETVGLNRREPQFEFHFLFNMNADGTRHPAIADLRVRQAIAHAIDKQQIVDVVFGGNAMPSKTMFDGGGRFNSWLAPDIESYAFDLAEANAILEDAGYRDTDGDGVREMNDGSGTPLDFRLYAQSEKGPALPQAEMIQGWLAEIGIHVDVDVLESVTLRDYAMNAKDFDMLIYQYGPLWDPDYNLMELACIGIDYQVNLSGYCNPEYDDLYYAQRSELDDAVRHELIDRLQQIMHDDVAWIQLNFYYDFEAYRSDRFDLTITDSANQFWGWWGVWGLKPLR